MTTEDYLKLSFLFDGHQFDKNIQDNRGQWQDIEKDLLGANAIANGISSRKYDYKCFPISLLSANRLIIND